MTWPGLWKGGGVKYKLNYVYLQFSYINNTNNIFISVTKGNVVGGKLPKPPQLRTDSNIIHNIGGDKCRIHDSNGTYRARCRLTYVPLAPSVLTYDFHNFFLLIFNMQLIIWIWMIDHFSILYAFSFRTTNKKLGLSWRYSPPYHDVRVFFLDLSLSKWLV